MASPLVLTTSSHILTFHPSTKASSGGLIDTPFYILERRADSAVDPLACPYSSESSPSADTGNCSESSPQRSDSDSSSSSSCPKSTDLTVHDTITIDEDALDTDRLYLKLQDTEIGSIPKDDATTLAEFLMAWRDALATLEEQVNLAAGKPDQDPLSSDYVSTRLMQERDAFVDLCTVPIRLITWNLHGEIIAENLRPLLFGSSVLSESGETQDPSIFLIGLQEADPLTATTLSTKQATVSRWSELILSTLGSSYVTTASSELLGMVLLMFVHRKLAPLISDVQLSSTGTGVLGYWGNKGAVCIRFTLGENYIAGTSGVEFAVLNMHLSSGINTAAVERRRWELSAFGRRLELPRFNGTLFRKTRNGGKNRNELLFQNGDLVDEFDERSLDDDQQRERFFASTSSSVDNNDDYEAQVKNVTSSMTETSVSEIDPLSSVVAGSKDGDSSASSTPPSIDDSENAATMSTTSTSVTTAAMVNSDNVGPEREINSIVFVLGDLNYRLEMERRDVETLVSKRDYRALLFWDQLSNEIKEQNILVGFQEGPISFPPTYKYDIGSVKAFDSSEKARIPAYTDRIFYTPYPSLAQLDYESFPQYISSDHKPVAATFELRTMLVDIDKRSQIVKRLLHDMDARENESRPKVEVESTELVCPDMKALSVITKSVKFKNFGNTQVSWLIERLDGSTLEIEEVEGTLPPGASHNIRVSLPVPIRITEISEIFILRIVNRQDYFITLTGNVLPSCFGASLEDMIRKPNGARNGYINAQSGPQLNIPCEIWKCVDYLSPRLTKNIFRPQGDEVVGQLIRDWLDDGTDFDAQILDSLENDGNKGVHSVAEQFLTLLRLVDGGIIPEEAYDTVIRGADGVSLIFEAMPRINVNTLIFIAAFLKQVQQTVIDFDLILELFDKALIRMPPNAKDKPRYKRRRFEFYRAFIG
ncbi:Endonuclease/exonuclease/phosphatase [Lipomyces oligophaga]|uniref:Endonuclease/exonuclease/phosphatase n=1 Tax=Lipomyces oligophaga TaxID=45792 RepID=UPI0034CD4B2D